jgi:hypothetical protein
MISDTVGIPSIHGGEDVKKEDLGSIFEYVEKGPIAVPYTLVYRALERIVPERRQQIMGWLTEPFYQRGKDEGRSEGRVEGEAHMFVRLMEKRFGVVPPELRERIRAANAATLEVWAERILEAPDLQSVFESK